MDMGFKTNGYNKCTFNKMINEYQCTIQVHVNDLKLSFVRQDELNKIIAALNEIFGSNGDLLRASYGKVHEYLGMDINWSIEGMVVFTMYDYLEDILAESPPYFEGEDVTPAVNELFTVNLTHRKLDTLTSDLFHCIVAKFFCIAKRARPDLQVAVVFLCKQVKCPNVGDWKKLDRLVLYVRAIVHLPLIVGSDRTGNMVRSIDASFAVHTDMKSYTGYCLTLGISSPISGASTQKVNTRSSTEFELVGVDDGIGFVDWSSLYSKKQVKEYPTEHPLEDMGKKTVLLQDNTNTITMLMGGKRVRRQQTRNIHIRYFYAHERVADGTIIVTYYPTKEMVSDYLSKPL